MKASLLDDSVSTINAARDRQQRDLLIREIFSDSFFLDKIKNFVIKNSGSQQDYEDILNDGIMAFLKMCMKKDFIISTEPRSYLYGLIRNLWLSHLRKNKIKLKHLSAIQNEENVTESDIESVMIQKEKKYALDKVLSLLSHTCQEVLTMWAYNISMTDIAQQTDLSSAGTVRKKKHDCLKKLNNILKANPSLKKKLR